MYDRQLQPNENESIYLKIDSEMKQIFLKCIFSLFETGFDANLLNFRWILFSSDAKIVINEWTSLVFLVNYDNVNLDDLIMGFKNTLYLKQFWIIESMD